MGDSKGDHLGDLILFPSGDQEWRSFLGSPLLKGLGLRLDVEQAHVSVKCFYNCLLERLDKNAKGDSRLETNVLARACVTCRLGLLESHDLKRHCSCAAAGVTVTRFGEGAAMARALA